MSERRACRLVNQPRGTQRYQLTQREDEDALTEAIVELAMLQSMLNDSFESHAMLRLKSVRKDDHQRTDTCIVHAPGFCLSAAAI
jgi:hypothetical protein